jgi:hypothetical protein
MSHSQVYTLRVLKVLPVSQLPSLAGPYNSVAARCGAETMHGFL